MAKKVQKKETGKKRTTFTFEAAWADEVILMGDFNNWDAKKHPMKKDKAGIWKKTAILSPGRYEYKFLVNGQWENDPENDQTSVNCFGTQNNIINI
ncbi:MAG: isoamylase early set domain-containing protein [Pseudomonadota bacterium]